MRGLLRCKKCGGLPRKDRLKGYFCFNCSEYKKKTDLKVFDEVVKEGDKDEK